MEYLDRLLVYTLAYTIHEYVADRVLVVIKIHLTVKLPSPPLDYHLLQINRDPSNIVYG